MPEIGEVWAFYSDTGEVCSNELWTVLKVSPFGPTIFLVILYNNEKHMVSINRDKVTAYKIC